MSLEKDKVKIIKPQKGFQEEFVSTNVDFAIGGGMMNSGKAEILDNQIVTPFGLRRMGDLKVGDIISSKDGGMQKVIGVFERGLMDAYKVEFKDGREVICGKDHLWNIRKSATFPKRYLLNGKHYKDLWSVWSTEMMYDFLQKENKGKKTLYTPNCERVQFTRGNWVQGNTIPPYILGSLLGDGCLSEKTSCIRFTTADLESVEEFRKYGYKMDGCKGKPYDYKVSGNDIRKRIEQKGLLGKLSDTKFIPEVYKFSPIDARTELLQGLFDTDGYISDGGFIEYCTVSEQLCNDVCFVVRSLGGNVRVSTAIGSYIKPNGERQTCKKAYRLQIAIKDSDKYFALTRKKIRGGKKNRVSNKSGDLESPIKSVEKLGYKEEMRCIRVSNPDSLYITNDFIVTHNTSAAVLMSAQPCLEPQFNAVFLRNNLGDLRAGGGMIDEFKDFFKGYITAVESGEPHINFPSGARVDLTHIADQNRDAILKRFKGRQYDLIYFDEGTGFTWEAFTTVCSRNRGKANWTGKIRMTTNPKRSHWIRRFIDWYVGIDGYIIPERSGVVRYFFNDGKTVEDVVWGETKEEVYEKCKVTINNRLNKMNKNNDFFSYGDLIKSFTFLLGSMSENKESIKNNKGYAASVSMMGGEDAEANLDGNWNVDPMDDTDVPITAKVARKVVENDVQANNDKWITVDLADYGTDNLVSLVWDGFHIIDMMILNKSTPRENAMRVVSVANRHNIANSHIIYDATSGRYFSDYVPEAVAFMSNWSPRGLYGRNFMRLKDECYGRFVYMMNKGLISMSDKVANMPYTHETKSRSKDGKRNISTISLSLEFIEECGVVQFNDLRSGKKQLLTKKEMNQKLGKSRSMDVLDPCAMRMLPVLEYMYGEELMNTTAVKTDSDEDNVPFGMRTGTDSIFGAGAFGVSY